VLFSSLSIQAYHAGFWCMIFGNAGWSLPQLRQGNREYLTLTAARPDDVVSGHNSTTLNKSVLALHLF
jgi:hypothetical protein